MDRPEIPGFRLIAVLGEGGTGAVWSAESVERPGELVAIKLLHLQSSLREKDVRRFLREGRLGAELRHPSILPVLGIGTCALGHYLVLEHCDGLSLAEHVLRLMHVRDGRATPEEALGALDLRQRISIVARVAEALEYAHRGDVVHRDVKPANVLVRADGHPFLIDFGIARELTAIGTTTSTGSVIGTPAFMSPEQIAGRVGEVDARSDVYSLGATLYQAISLRLPFECADFVELRTAILHDEPRPLVPLPPGAPRGLDAVVMRAMEKDPRHRYASAAELRDDLEGLLAGRAPRVRRSTLALHRGLRLLGRHRQRALAAGAAAAVLVAAILWAALGATTGELRAQRGQQSFANGRLLLEQGAHDQALAEIESGIAQDPSSAAGYLEMAVALARVDRMRDAPAYLDRAIEFGLDVSADAVEPELAHAQGLYWFAKRDDARAEACLRRALEGRPVPYWAHFTLYQLYRRRGDEGAGAAELATFARYVREVDPRRDVILGQLAELAGDHAAAESLFLAQLARARDERQRLEMRWHIGRLYLAMQRYEEAMTELRAALGARPDDVGSWANLATAQLRAKDVAGARESAERALELLPGLPSACLVLAEIEANAGDYDLALACIDTVRERDRAAPNVREFEGQVALALWRDLSRAGRDADAAGALARIPDARPADVVPLANLASSLHADGAAADDAAQLERAFRLCEHAAPACTTSAEPTCLSLHTTRFAVALRLGRDDAAEESLRFLRDALSRAEQVDPGIALNLAEALATGDPSGTPVDCPWARRLVDEHGLRQAFAGHGDAEAILEAIDAACP